MTRIAFFCVAALLLPILIAQQPAGAPQQRGARPQIASIQPTPEETQKIQTKVGEMDALVRNLKAHHVDEGLLADVDIFAKSGRWLLEFPQDFFTQDGIDNALSALDAGLERAKQLQKGESPWATAKGKQVHGFYSALDGSVQPYGLTIPESYDGTGPVRLYVWLHGRNARLTEANFLHTFANSKTGVADVGQIQLDVYGRGNNANHWAGEVDVFETIAAVEKRYKIDPKRVLLRGFSLGGAAAWHLALQYPDRWAAAEIGAGTWPRRSLMSDGLPPYQQATLRIWENITEWALNAFNLPLAAHDGDSDTQVASIPRPEPGAPTRGQLESSIRVREQLAKEGFPSEGEPNALSAKGTPAIFLISEHTGHGTSPAVRQRLDAFLKEYGDRGQISPEHIRFLTYATRYNRSYWVSLDALDKHYERSEVDAERTADGKQYTISTKNVARLALRETDRAAEIKIDGQALRVKPANQIELEKTTAGWRRASSSKTTQLLKTHGLQGPIDDAFLDPFLCVRPTGTAWNDAVNQQALRTLAQFDRLYAKNYRAHPRIKDDKDVTEADFAKYNVALFGDPGSNRWILKLNARTKGKLPLVWTKETITFGERKFSAGDHLPVMVYPNPLSPSHYVVLNSALTIDEREYNSDYSMPRLGDFAFLKLTGGAEAPDVAYAGLFDEHWLIPKERAITLSDSTLR
jgi:pimeloyl-ACP methyl ester carboxylesterase